MADIFKVNQHYLTDMQLLEDLDKYEKLSGFKLFGYDTRTFETVFKRGRKRFHTGEIKMYEGVYRCTEGKKKTDSKDSKK